MTYQEIVSALRHCATPETCDVSCPRAGIGEGCIRGLKIEAAAAIEKLSARENFADTVLMAKWIKDEMSGLLYCSHCGTEAPLDTTGPTQYQSKFCPGCGAYMRGGGG